MKSNTSAQVVVPGQYIVVFKDQGKELNSSKAAQQAIETTQSLLSEYSINSDSLLSQYKYALKGFASKLTAGQVKKLKKDPRIDHISPNKIFHLDVPIVLPKGANKSRGIASSSQTIPWGVERVGGPLDGTSKKAWIIGSGIDLDHPDLNVDNQNSISYISGESADDIIGHGTYVAGILAAKDNNTDVVGVAAGATVVAIKVCTYFTDPATGVEYVGCPTQSILDGIDYVDNHANSNDIVNMSLGGPIDQDLDDAVTDAANDGIRFVISAGNDKDNAGNHSPARVNNTNVWTVSAYREGDDFAADFDCGTGCNAGSNYGNPPIDYAAPGEDVPSLRIGGGWGMGFSDSQDDQGTEDGTSYAAPHLAGLLLVSGSVDLDGTVFDDPDGNPDAIAIDEEPLQVYVSGPSLVNDGDMASFSASVSHQEGSVSYQWYYRTSPSDPWVLDSGSTSSTYSRTFHNPGGYEDQAVKAVVNSAGESASDVHAVTVKSCSQTTITSNGTVKPNDINPCN